LNSQPSQCSVIIKYSSSITLPFLTLY